MLNNTKRIKELYEEIQRKIFYAVPGKWDELYLYASIIERLGKIQTGEMYFYFLPKALLKRKFINVYEVPSKYDIEEEEYLNLINLLYDNIKELREEFIKSNQPVWSNITITIKNNRFKIEYNYDTGVYLKRKTNIITYDTTDFKENQRVEYLAKNQGVKKTINQILSK